MMSEHRKILVVEDEPIVLKVAGLALRSQGLESSEARDVASAAEILRAGEFGVVVTDLKLPGASGFELLRLSRTLDPSPQVIIITGYATIENALESFRLGCFDFVPKPFDVDELVSVVGRASRYFDYPRSPREAEANQYFLGRHSWVRLEPDGAATLGAAETVTSVAGPIEAIECRDRSNHTRQGEWFCRLTSRDGLRHRVWAPISGRVISRNFDLDDDLDLIQREPLSAGWLVRVIPSRLEEELVNLGSTEE